MRQPRLKAPPSFPAAVYHCLSRVVDRRFLFGPAEKDHFVSLLRECERFSRVRVLTFAILSNHFHLLVEVPKRPDLLPGPDEILDDLKRLSGHQFPEAVRQRFDLLRQSNDPAALAAYLASFHARMFDVSAFMKLLKQRFTQWYNTRHGRRGTLWEERFRSVLVDGSGEALVTMAAYIDLNPVRARIVQDPKDYPWCGYAEAFAGRRRAKNGIQSIVTALRRGLEESQDRSLETYRLHLLLQGDERRETLGEDGRSVRGSFSAEAVDRVLAAKGRLPLSDYLRCRVRYFCDGAVFGGREFVEGIFRHHRDRFGSKRRTGARPLRGLAEPPLFTVRDLQREVIRAPSGGPQP